MRELFTQQAGRVALELVGKILRRIGGSSGNEQVNVIGQHFQAFDGNTQRIRLFVQQCFQAFRNRALQYLAPVFRTPDKVVMQRVDAARVRFEGLDAKENERSYRRCAVKVKLDSRAVRP